MLVIGLTGGIASGKSTVAKLFAKKGIPIIDTDEIARELVEPGMPALQEISEYFGKEILNEGKLNRRALRQHIFHHPEDKRWLESCLHPRIRAITDERILQVTAPYCMVVIPLLFETTRNPLIQRILVVDVAPEIQVARLMARDQLTESEATNLIAQQIAAEHRRLGADDLISNDREESHLQAQVDHLHALYISGKFC